MFYSIVGILFAVAGIRCLYLAWRDNVKKPKQILLGWGGIGLTPWWWSQSSGTEFGWTYALIMLAVVALLLIGWKIDLSAQTKAEKQPDNKIFYRARAIPKNLLLFVLAVPLAGVSATMLTMTVISLLPLSRVNVMVLSVYSMPVVWGLASYWACTDSKIVRPALGLTVLGGLSAVFIYM